METSCREYDSGNREEAIRLALQMRIIFHQTGSSTSLLTHMKSNFVQMLTTSAKRPAGNSSGFWPGLVQFVLDPQESIFIGQPKFDANKPAHRFVPFRFWWEEEPIYQFGHKKLRRRDLILAASNKDGGGHVDVELPADYKWVADGMGWKMTINPDNGPQREIVLQFAHLASIRQMAYEVLASPSLLKLAVRA